MATYLCTACGYDGPGRKTKRGSGRAEMMIWTLLLVPGPIYSLWRRVGLTRVCSHCGLPTVVNAKSSAGRMAQRKIDIELGLITIAKPAEKKELEGFGNTRPPEKKERKRPVKPEEW
jgi:ribosomal protein L37E